MANYKTSVQKVYTVRLLIIVLLSAAYKVGMKWHISIATIISLFAYHR